MTPFFLEDAPVVLSAVDRMHKLKAAREAEAGAARASSRARAVRRLVGPQGFLFAIVLFLALTIAAIVLSSCQSGLTKSTIIQILFVGDLWPTQVGIRTCEPGQLR